MIRRHRHVPGPQIRGQRRPALGSGFLLGLGLGFGLLCLGCEDSEQPGAGTGPGSGAKSAEDSDPLASGAEAQDPVEDEGSGASPEPMEAVRAAVRAVFGDHPPSERMVFDLRPAEDPRPAARVLMLVDGPERLRLNFRDDSRTLLRGAGGDHVWSNRERPRPATDEESRTLDDYRALCDMVLLTELRQVERAERRTDGQIAVHWTRSGEQPEGSPRPELVSRLSVDAEGRATALERPDHQLRFLDFRETGSGWLPTRLTSDRLGEFGFRIVAHDLGVDATSFQVPSADDDWQDRAIDTPSSRGVRRVTRPAARLLWIPDPGEWAERFDALQQAGDRLGQAGCRPAGEDAGLVVVGGERFLQIAFHGPAGRELELALKPGERLERRETGPALAITAPDGPWSRRIDQAEAELREALGDADPDGRPPELLFNHLTRSEQLGDPRTLQTMLVELRQGLR